MASGIGETDSMFYVREVPWHGMGTRVEEALSSKDAIKIAGLDWTVNPLPMFLNIGGKMIEVPNAVANTRSSDNRVLGVVTDRYKIVQNVDAFEFTDNILGSDVRYETAGSLFDGQKVWLLARMPDSIVVGDKYENYLFFTNTHDGKGSIRVGISPVRVVCNNTLNLAISSASRSWTTKHMGDMTSKLSEARRTLELAADYQVAFNKEAEIMAGEKITMEEFEVFVKNIIPIEDSASDRQKKNSIDAQNELFSRYYYAPDLENFRGTKWGAMQAVSDFVTHTTPKRVTDTYQEHMFNKVLNGHTMMDKAYDLLAVA